VALARVRIRGLGGVCCESGKGAGAVCCGFDLRRDSSVTSLCLMYVNNGGASTRAHSRIGRGVLREWERG